ncbi:MAG TPA: response regulator, partial [Thermodesulfovibrionales bacterium]|nr:response regulator [Thermodesulfovibrionales bacterium]
METKRILIVDDEAYIRTLVRELVVSEELEVEEAADAAQGIEIYSKTKPDLIITDIVLPDISGIEFIKRIRTISRSVPVIVITGYSGTDDAYDLVSLNVFSYLKKPFTDLNSFGTAIRKAIDPGKGYLAGIDGKFVKTYADEAEHFFDEIVTAKQEWESAVDFVEKIFMLIDPEMALQRCNHALCAITGLQYKDLIGRKWYEVMKLTGFVPVAGDYHMFGGVEFFNDSNGRWMLLQAYPFYEVVSGRKRSVRQVLTFYDITETKLATEEIRSQREKIRAQNIDLQNHKEKLEGALEQLSRLILQVEREQSFNIRFENPNLVTCSEALSCGKADCPCFGSQYVRCWQIAGTHCACGVQYDLPKKIKTCEDCPVYITATTNPVFRIGEHFNNMMNMLERKNREVQEAYEKLKATQGQVLQQ